MHPEITTPQCVLDRTSVTMPPDQNPNYRNNPSILIRHVTQRKPDSSNSSSSDVKYVQIDACKTFREGVLRWYPRHGVTSLDGIVLTHDHADAMFGLDDVSKLYTLHDVALLCFMLASARFARVAAQRQAPVLFEACGSCHSSI
jgi:glyoxylase-like metal-dependent hydrolase (beta-lactamase superfamily II)